MAEEAQATQVTEEGDENPSPAPATAEEEFFQISKKNAFGDLGRLINENPNLAHAVRTIGGRQSKQEALRYQAELEELRSRYSQLENESARSRYSSIEPEDLAEQLRTNPQFATEYSRAMSAQNPQPQVTREMLEARAELDGIKDELLAAGAPQDWIPSLDAYIQRGQFGQSIPSILRNVTKWADQQIAQRSWEPPKEEPAKTEEPEEDPEKAPATPRENRRLGERDDMTPQPRGGAGTGSRKSRTSIKTKNDAVQAFYRGEISSAEMRRIENSALPEF